jgi:hypothetical protein
MDSRLLRWLFETFRVANSGQQARLSSLVNMLSLHTALPESQNSVIPEQMQRDQPKHLSNHFQPIVCCTFRLLSLKVDLERMCKPHSTWGQEYRAASFRPSVGWIRYCSYAWSWNPIGLRSIQFKTDVDSKARDKSASQQFHQNYWPWKALHETRLSMHSITFVSFWRY